MTDREEIINCYKAMYDGEIAKDIEFMRPYSDESYVLVHMTGTRMNREEYFSAILDGTLNYYWCEHEHMDVTVNGNHAKMTGDTRVEADEYPSAGSHYYRIPVRIRIFLSIKHRYHFTP